MKLGSERDESNFRPNHDPNRSENKPVPNQSKRNQSELHIGPNETEFPTVHISNEQPHCLEKKMLYC